MVAISCHRVVGALVLASVASPVCGETVETLTNANFNRRIQEADIILVKFYAPWCGHCKAMAPAYEEAAQTLARNSPPIPLGKVDATVETQAVAGQNIRGYPTLKIFRKGAASDYGGPRDANGIVTYMKQQAGAPSPPGPASGSSPSLSGESPLLMAKLCRDQTCNDPEFPLIDYDENENKCVCAGHPCWNDDGKAHSCPTEASPHLTFSYTAEGKLECGCRAEPHYMSKYIAQVKCPGQSCDDGKFPVMDYVPAEKKCVCKAHPCDDLNGQKHACATKEFPILNYREEQKPEGGIKQICECKAPLHYKKEEL